MRYFIAATLPHRVKEEIVSLQKDLLDDNVICTRVKTDAMHLTLAFLGDVGEEQIDAIRNALCSVRFTPIDTALRGIGAFTWREQVRIIWAGLANEQKIASLAKKIYATIRPLGFEPDRAFAAHVTICRVRQVKDKIVLQKKIASMHVSGEPFTISSFTLFSSTLTPKSPDYRIIAEFKAE